MSFFSRRVLLATGTTKEILSIPGGVSVKCMMIKTVGEQVKISAHADAVNTGLTMEDGQTLTFNDGELSTMDGEEKQLFVYNAGTGDTYIEIMGVLVVIGLASL